MTLKHLSFSLVLIGLLSVTHAMAMEDSRDDLQGTTVRIQLNYQELKAVGESYVTFLQKVGQLDRPVTQEDVSQLFASQCKKIVNAKVLCTSSSELADQLNTARGAAGKWTIETLLIIPALEIRACTLQIKWRAEKMENEHTTMKVLFLDKMGKIYQIDEVYNECLKYTLGSS